MSVMTSLVAAKNSVVAKTNPQTLHIAARVAVVVVAVGGLAYVSHKLKNKTDDETPAV